jgi:hypothetical protein
MKTHIMFRRALTALACAAVLALPPGRVQAQTNGAPKPKSQSSAPSQYDLEIENDRLLSPGPNHPGRAGEPDLDNIVKLLRERHPEANIAMVPDLENVRISNLKLRAASLGEVLEALRVASGYKFTWKAQFQGDAMPLFTLEPSEQFLKTRQPSISEGPIVVEAFNFSAYFAYVQNSQPMEDGKFQAFKTQAIDTTMKIISKTLEAFGPSRMTFQFHPGANLLVVTGTQDEINVAKKVINAMMEQPGTPNTGANNAAQSEAMRRQADENAADLQLLRQLEVLNRLRTNSPPGSPADPSRPNFFPVPPASVDESGKPNH